MDEDEREDKMSEKTIFICDSCSRECDDHTKIEMTGLKNQYLKIDLCEDCFSRLLEYLGTAIERKYSKLDARIL
jgi:predicted metal-binding protein